MAIASQKMVRPKFCDVVETPAAIREAERAGSRLAALLTGGAHSHAYIAGRSKVMAADVRECFACLSNEQLGYILRHEILRIRRDGQACKL